MGLRQQLLPEPTTPAAVPFSTNAERELEVRITQLACKLSEEGARRSPDRTVLGNLLDDLDALVADYKREQARTRR